GVRAGPYAGAPDCGGACRPDRVRAARRWRKLLRSAFAEIEFMKTKILVVEDDPHISLGLEEILESEGYEIAVCNRGDKALDAVARQRPNLIVLDVMLPGLSGYDVCKQLRAKKVA